MTPESVEDRPGTQRAFDLGMGERFHAPAIHRTVEPARGAVGRGANERPALVFFALLSVLGGCTVPPPTRAFFADAAAAPEGDECGCGAPPICGQACLAFCGCCGCSGTETVLVHEDGAVAAYRCRVSAGSPPESSKDGATSPSISTPPPTPPRSRTATERCPAFGVRPSGEDDTFGRAHCARLRRGNTATGEASNKGP